MKETYEIGNAGEPYTVEADRPSVACAAVIYLGETRFSLKNSNGREIMPANPGITRGRTTAEWFQDRFDQEIYEFIFANRDEIAECLKSILVGTVRDREIFKAASDLMDTEETRAIWLERWNELARKTPQSSIRMKALHRAHELVSESDPSVLLSRARARSCSYSCG